MRLVTLDVTTRALLQREQVQALSSTGSPVTGFIQQVVGNFLDTFGQPRGITAFQMHDPLCLAAAFRPELITWEPAYVDVELAGTLTLGQTVAYFERPEAIDPSLEHRRSPNVLASVGVDAEQFIALYIERIRSNFQL